MRENFGKNSGFGKGRERGGRERKRTENGRENEILRNSRDLRIQKNQEKASDGVCVCV